jgi:hypothetical protein
LDSKVSGLRCLHQCTSTFNSDLGATSIFKPVCFASAERNWRGDIDDPTSRTSKRPLTLGYLVDRYRAKAVAGNAQQAESLLDAVLESDGVSDEVIGFHCQQTAFTAGS